MSRPERGAGTVLGVVAVSALLVLGLVLAEVAGLVRAHRRAEAAADLAALAAAQAGSCEAAARIATANGATLLGCRVVGHDALVEVGVTPARAWAPAARLTAQARAGPGAGEGQRGG